MEIVDLIDGALMDSERWFPKMAHEPFFIAGCLAGEVGEVLNLLKKVERGTHTFTPEMKADVAEEVADVFTYLLHLAGALSIDLEAEYNKKRKANEIRFSARRALEQGNGHKTQIIQNLPPIEADKPCFKCGRTGSDQAPVIDRFAQDYNQRNNPERFMHGMGICPVLPDATQIIPRLDPTEYFKASGA